MGGGVIGVGEFTGVDFRRNKLFFYGQDAGWRTTWDLIVPVRTGSKTFTNLLFYNRSEGAAEFWTGDGSHENTLLAAYTGWRTSWDLILPGHFGGDDNTDLLFYDRAAGVGEFLRGKGRGGLGPLKVH